MVGFIFKYQAIPGGDLRDRGRMPDPNFWVKNVKATWTICGPYRRQTLAREGRGTVFFVPHKSARQKLGLPPVCTGVLVVDRIIPDRSTLNESHEFSEAFMSLYRTDLDEHLKRDPAPTKKIRSKNIIIGSPKSRWLGKRCVNLLPLLKRLKIKGVAHGLAHNRVVRALTDTEAENLYEAVIQKWRKTKPIETPHLKNIQHRKVCRVCH